jgi:flagellar motility protein MotE (MotC chaperone)
VSGRLAASPTLSVRPPRLLPLTIAVMAALLVVKSIVVVRAAIPGAVDLHPSFMIASTSPPAAPVPPNPATKPMTIAAPPHPRPADEQVSDSERGLLLDLRARRTELEAREATLGVREAVLSGAERRLSTRVDELTSLQAKLEALETGRREHDEANWRGLVKLYEAMRPRDAAAIFNELDRPVLLGLLDRMKEAKAAAVLAAMLPDRARQATTELSQMRGQATRPP